MRRETQNILLVLLGGALLKLALTGTYLRYVKESLQPWLVVTGGVMVVLALVSIVRDIRGGQAHAEEHAEEHSGHEHGTSRSPWMLLLPVFAVFLISPPALGADTVNRSDRNAAQQANASERVRAAAVRRGHPAHHQRVRHPHRVGRLRLAGRPHGQAHRVRRAQGRRRVHRPADHLVLRRGRLAGQGEDGRARTSPRCRPTSGSRPPAGWCPARRPRRARSCRRSPCRRSCRSPRPRTPTRAELPGLVGSSRGTCRRSPRCG